MCNARVHLTAYTLYNVYCMCTHAYLQTCINMYKRVYYIVYACAH